jgi:hypothetical protein
MVIALEINAEIESNFRNEIGRIWGNKRGHMTKATEEAIQLWISKQQLQEPENTN